MSPLKDEHGIDGAEDYPDDEEVYGEEATGDEGSGEEAPGEEGPGGEPAVEGPGEGRETAPGNAPVHEVMAERPRRRRHGKGRRRHGRPGPPEQPRKPIKKIYVLIIALVIIVPLAGAAYFFFGPAISIRKIDLIARPYVDEQTRVPGMALAAFIDAGKPSSLSGQGDVRISLSGTRVYSGRMEVSESVAKGNLPLERFATGNGDYRVQFSFQGVTTSTTFTLTEIIEKINFTAFNITHINNPTLVPEGSARLGITVTFMNNANVTQLAAERDGLEIEIIRGGSIEKHTETIGARPQINTNYTVPGNGNYTVRATFTNSKVLPGSQYSRIVAVANDSQTNQPHIIVTIPPTANAGPDKTAQWKLSEGGAVVKFDGTASITYEGATVALYSWDYGDGTGEDGPKPTHTYTSPPSTSEPDRYVAILTITDSNGQSSSDTLAVTITL